MITEPPLIDLGKVTEKWSSRVTKEGRTISYRLRVIQQPERARACGAGAKSAADRRPVDPPPIVELRIYEADPKDANDQNEITFSYNANFFLFATLEWERAMAHGRVQGQPTCPVLTGVAVAGIAYLDNPSKAGYFIFPDLSVRHEGRYCLNFNLYEEVEEVKEAKDEDKTTRPPIQDSSIISSPTKPNPPQQFLNFRLEVKSNPFVVFSAKKFPGLSESTRLSHRFAEQGCRVRIRRDVRMRRREAKPTDKYGYGERHMTPDVATYPGTPVQRPRSTSNTSIDHPYGYSTTPQHPPPHQEMAYPPPPQPLPPQYKQPSPVPDHGPAGPPPAPSHLSFGAAQTQYYTPQPPAQPPSSRAGYSPHPGYSQDRRLSRGSEHEPQTPQNPPPYAHSRPVSQRSDHSRASLPPLSLQVDPYNSCAPDPRVSDPSAYQMPPGRGVPLTPISGSNQNPGTPHAATPQEPHPENPQLSMPSSIYGKPRPRGPSSYETNSVLSKRPHDDVFGSGHHSQRLYDGQRPNEATSDPDDDSKLLVYTRANGQVSMVKDRFPND